MASDMEIDVFADEPYGKVALKKLAPVPSNFRLFSAGWVGEKREDWYTMKVTGAEFSVGKSGENKGKLAVMVKGTQRSAYVTRSEMKC